MPENTTLVVKHFPPNYTKEERIEFMKTFHAIEVKCLISKYKKQSLIFAKFKSRREAEAVIKHLHQVELDSGYFLSVEFAKGNEQTDFIQDFESKNEKSTESKDDQTSQRRVLEDFLLRLNSWSKHLDFRHPPPHHLSYQYPPPSTLVLTNIARALAAVPKFYTQVLHLMNKMCLPCPFTDNYRISSELVPEYLSNLFPEIDSKQTSVSKSVNTEEESAEESEIESDPDTANVHIETPSLKRPLKSKKESKIKRLRLLKPSLQPKVEKTGPIVKPEEVFEITSQKAETKKIEVKVVSDLNTVATSGNDQQEVTVEGFEKIEPKEKNVKETENKETEEEDEDQNDRVISGEELAMNRISTRDQQMLPVFKNYQPGLPSCRLYLKNLAKTVELSDLRFIYKRYFIEQKEEQGTMFDIRLMQEGRMKGQAFITLQNEKQAELALKETNGYILKGKPMVVQFARAKPK